MKGTAIGGPVMGEIFEYDVPNFIVPVKIGPDRGEGDRGFAAYHYVFRGGLWWGETTYEWQVRPA